MELWKGGGREEKSVVSPIITRWESKGVSNLLLRERRVECLFPTRWFYFQINTLSSLDTNGVRDKPREILIMQKFYRTYFQENDIDNKLNKQRAKYKVQFSEIRNNKNRNSRGKKVLRNIWKMHSSFFSISLDSSIELSKNITIYLQWNIFSILLCVFERNWSIYLLLRKEGYAKAINNPSN